MSSAFIIEFNLMLNLLNLFGWLLDYEFFIVFSILPRGMDNLVIGL